MAGVPAGLPAGVRISDHISFGVSSRAELKAWQDHLAANSVDQSPITDAGGYAVLVFRDPDNIQLEFIVMGPD